MWEILIDNDDITKIHESAVESLIPNLSSSNNIIISNIHIESLCDNNIILSNFQYDRYELLSDYKLYDSKQYIYNNNDRQTR